MRRDTLLLRQDVVVEDRGAVRTLFVREEDTFAVKQILRQEGFHKLQTKPLSRGLVPVFLPEPQAKRFIAQLRAIRGNDLWDDKTTLTGSNGEPTMTKTPPAVAADYRESLRRRVSALFHEEAAEKWWKTPSSFFEGYSPAELVESREPEKLRRVENALVRLEEGIYV